MVAFWVSFNCSTNGSLEEVERGSWEFSHKISENRWRWSRGLVYLPNLNIWAKPGRGYLETWQIEKAWSFKFAAANISPSARSLVKVSNFLQRAFERPGMRVVCTTWLWILSPELWLSGTWKIKVGCKWRRCIDLSLCKGPSVCCWIPSFFFEAVFSYGKNAGKISLSRKIGEDVQFDEKFHMGWNQHLGPYSWITSITVFVLINKMSKPLVHQAGWSKVDLPLFPRLLDKIWHQAVEWWLHLWKWSHLQIHVDFVIHFTGSQWSYFRGQLMTLREVWPAILPLATG